MRFSAVTLGCKVNQYESQSIEGILVSRGHVHVKSGEGCDACIINTCAITAESERKSRQAVRRMRKMEPGAIIAVCGCYSQLAPEAIEQLGADLIGGSGDRVGFALEIERVALGRVARLQETRSPETSSPGSRPPATRYEDIPPGGGAARTRALLKIQDGCSNYCAYCIVPYVRGRARSLPIARAAENAKLLGERGFREIVITGIEISSYGIDLEGSPTLAEAVQEICASAPNARFRLGSLDPSVVTGDFCLKLRDISNLCDHFHLSLQSGCNDTLQRMGRRYSPGEAAKAIAQLRDLFPGCGITADLIVGFPGETDAEFAQTLGFIKAAGFSDMHIFPFSARPGTLAAAMPGQVGKGVKKERARTAAETAEGMARSFRLALIGRTVEVLFERKRNGFWVGHAGNYVEVAAINGGARNEICNVMITSVKDIVAWGEIQPPA